MTDQVKIELLGYLCQARESVVWKLEGLGERDVRRPLTPTGTNLLGLVKHLALVEAGYFGEVFQRPYPEKILQDNAEDNADMWATAQESRDDVLGLYRRVWVHSDDTIETLPLDAMGAVPWWPSERRSVTLHRILVHTIAETHRHAGHADLTRELIDGEAGRSKERSNMPAWDDASWSAHFKRLQAVADSF